VAICMEVSSAGLTAKVSIHHFSDEEVERPYPIGSKTSQDHGRKPSTSPPQQGRSKDYPTPMMHLQFGDGEDLGRRSRLFVALTSFILQHQ
jgi:hypothetical protein